MCVILLNIERKKNNFIIDRSRGKQPVYTNHQSFVIENDKSHMTSCCWQYLEMNFLPTKMEKKYFTHPFSQLMI